MHDPEGSYYVCGIATPSLAVTLADVIARSASDEAISVGVLQSGANVAQGFFAARYVELFLLYALGKH